MKYLPLFMVMFVTSIIANIAAHGAWTGSQFHSTRSCDKCHVPHAAAGDNSQVPLWNPTHQSTNLTGHYTPNAKSTDATMNPPDGASKLCLSCHDGSYSHVATNHAFSETMGTLENSHPVSFIYDTALSITDGELVDPETLPRDVLDAQGKMQCTSCHDIHSSASQGMGGTLAEPVGMVDSNGQPIYGPDGVTQLTTTNANDGWNLRWPYSSTVVGGVGTKATFCQKCHLK